MARTEKFNGLLRSIKQRRSSVVILSRSLVNDANNNMTFAPILDAGT